MIKSLVGFVVLVIGGGLGYFSKVTLASENEQSEYVEIAPVEFVVSGGGLQQPGGGGSCGS